MVLKLYDLAGREAERRFSPPCWRIKMALKHKGLEFETIPWRFTEKEAIAFSGQKRVPVLVDHDRVIVDSWDIAQYLDQTYPNHPPLFQNQEGCSIALFVKFWTEQTLAPLVLRIILMDLFHQIHPNDQPYFRETREQRLGMTLEAFTQSDPGAIAQLHQALTPLRSTLKVQPYLGGHTPNFADYIVFGVFQWARVVSPIPLLSPEDALYQWRDRLLDAFHAYARSAPGYPV
jgi:glutathione S-transferase